jgi:hypothetical protein
VAEEGLTAAGSQRHRKWMNELMVGYARVSTEQQDPTAQRNGLHALGVGLDRIYVDHGLTGTTRAYLGLRLALAAFRAGDTLVVTKLGRHLVGMQHPAERQLHRFADPCIMGDLHRDGSAVGHGFKMANSSQS